MCNNTYAIVEKVNINPRVLTFCYSVQLRNFSFCDFLSMSSLFLENPHVRTCYVYVPQPLFIHYADAGHQ